MRPSIALLAFTAACANSGRGPGHPELNVMNAPPVCDSVPPPARPGEQLGATVPEGVSAVPDSAMVVGTLTEVATARTLGAARLSLLRDTAFTSLAAPLSRAYTNAAGGFVLRGMPGTYTLDVRRIGGAPLRRQISLRAGVVDTLRLEMGYLHCLGY